jgi:hypothetical protein
MKKFFLLFLASVFVMTPDFVHASEGDPVNDEDKAYFSAIHDAVLGNAKEWLAGQLALPMKVTIHGHKVKIQTKKQFLQNYDEVINTYIRDSVRKQDINDLFKDWRGLMIGQGAIWYEKLGRNNSQDDPVTYCIIAINTMPP